MARRDETADGITQRTRVKTDLFLSTDGSLVDASGNVIGLTGAQVTATQALVSEAGNITAAELQTTTGVTGQVVRLSDGPDRGAILMWSTPEGSTTETWCWWLWPQAAY